MIRLLFALVLVPGIAAAVEPAPPLDPAAAHAGIWAIDPCVTRGLPVSNLECSDREALMGALSGAAWILRPDGSTQQLAPRSDAPDEPQPPGGPPAPVFVAPLQDPAAAIIGQGALRFTVCDADRALAGTADCPEMLAAIRIALPPTPEIRNEAQLRYEALTGEWQINMPATEADPIFQCLMPQERRTALEAAQFLGGFTLRGGHFGVSPLEGEATVYGVSSRNDLAIAVQSKVDSRCMFFVVTEVNPDQIRIWIVGYRLAVTYDRRKASPPPVN